MNLKALMEVSPYPFVCTTLCEMCVVSYQAVFEHVLNLEWRFKVHQNRWW